MKKVAIIDYGVGNLFSLQKALRQYADAVVTEDSEEVARADAIVLPGDGAFHAGMEGLKVRGLLQLMRQKIERGTPVLGICLGAQILLSKGYEFGEWEGLGIIPGKVEKLRAADAKIPHINWSPIVAPSGVSWENTILENIPQSTHMYFVHSFAMKPDEQAAILATTAYGGEEFCSVMRSGKVYGCQFHPEKSGTRGLAIIKNFIEKI